MNIKLRNHLIGKVVLSFGLLASIYSCREPLVDDPVIYGWGHSNGYYLSNLMSPHWTSNAPEQFPHSWNFYCIY